MKGGWAGDVTDVGHEGLLPTLIDSGIRDAW